MSDRPGREIPKSYREVIVHQLDLHGWRYDSGRKRGGHPVAYPADRRQPALAVPTSPGKDRRGFRNFISDTGRRGGHWPPTEEETA